MLALLRLHVILPNYYFCAIGRPPLESNIVSMHEPLREKAFAVE